MTSRFPPFAFVELVSHVASPYNKKNITRWLEDMNFMFSWQEQYLTRSLRSLVRYCSCHSNIKFISSRHRVISSIYLSADIIFSEKRTVFRERSSRKTLSYEEQIMSKDKYPNIFSPQMEAIVIIILQIFFATRAVSKIGGYSRISPSFNSGIFGHVTCLNQSRASEKI